MNTELEQSNVSLVSALRFRCIKITARMFVICQLLANRTKRCHRRSTTGSPKRRLSWFLLGLCRRRNIYMATFPSVSHPLDECSTGISVITLVKTTERPGHTGTCSYSAFFVVPIRRSDTSICLTEREKQYSHSDQNRGVCWVVNTWCQHILGSHGSTATYPIPDVFIFDDARLCRSHSLG